MFFLCPVQEFCDGSVHASTRFALNFFFLYEESSHSSPFFIVLFLEKSAIKFCFLFRHPPAARFFFVYHQSEVLSHFFFFCSLQRYLLLSELFVFRSVIFLLFIFFCICISNFFYFLFFCSPLMSSYLTICLSIYCSHSFLSLSLYVYGHLE